MSVRHLFLLGFALLFSLVTTLPLSALDSPDSSDRNLGDLLKQPVVYGYVRIVGKDQAQVQKEGDEVKAIVESWTLPDTDIKGTLRFERFFKTGIFVKKYDG